LSADSIHIDAEEFRKGAPCLRLTVCGDAVVFVPDIASAYQSRMKLPIFPLPGVSRFQALRKDLKKRA
jgi:hypothetical protein